MYNIQTPITVFILITWMCLNLTRFPSLKVQVMNSVTEIRNSNITRGEDGQFGCN